MRFLSDMGVSKHIVQWLRQNGEDAVHLRDEGLQKLPDSKIFDRAFSESRVILTFDLDSGEIAALSGGRIVSVILFRLHNTRTPHVLQRLQSALALRQELEKGAVIVDEEKQELLTVSRNKNGGFAEN
jgi:predicted nuclease of predicted toxin-antitoxin system